MFNFIGRIVYAKFAVRGLVDARSIVAIVVTSSRTRYSATYARPPRDNDVGKKIARI